MEDSSLDATGHHGDDDVINTLPEEILERILSFLSPYGECKQASVVCKRWHRVIQGVLQQKAQAFQSATAEGRLQWSYDECPVTPLTARHSHNMCRVGEQIYIFGGCSSSLTAFNDMWKLNLQNRTWSRVIALGSYPSPKAAATMVTYKDTLILFGGWAPPVPYPLHQAPHIFNELQVFNIKENRWNLVVTNANPPPVAGHQASVAGNKMIVFGGMIDEHHKGGGCVTNSYPPPVAGYQASVAGNKMIVFGGMIDEHHKLSDLYVLDLTIMSWRLINISQHKPSPRYGHVQYLLGDKHLLIIGGCGISNKTLSDVWLLQIGDSDDDWQWVEIEVRNQEHSPPVIFGHGACQVGNTITIFSKSKNPNKSAAMRRSQVTASAPRPAPSIPRPAPAPNAIERPAANIRQELRSHGVLLNGTKKRTHSDPSNSEANQPCNDMECQPSTSGQRSGQSSTDSQVCDELLHTNSFSATNMPSVGTSKNGNSGIGIGCASNVCFRRRMVQPNTTNSKCNTQETKPLQKSTLNQAHMGQLGPRKIIGNKKMASSMKPTFTNKDSKCLCSNQTMSRSPVTKHYLQQYVLDISSVITGSYVTWQPIKDNDSDNKVAASNRPITVGVSSQHGPPTERCFPSICEGRGELIMFGGLLEDSNQFNFGKSAINTVYYAT
ncbi:uncharacterized protein [Amphiura filiformis]|uniref:uncharacterized protein n=1 Tax=Amphiura filiformis TaxID=82378 RepID=UPI003B21C23D